MQYARWPALFLAGLLLMACDTVVAPTAPPTALPATPTAAAISLPTAAAQITSAPGSTAAAAPTEPASPAATGATSAGALPAPLYMVVGGQIVRLERDGTTRAPITQEPSPRDALAITDFTVSPKDSALAYLVQKPGGGTALIGTDAMGKQRTVLFDRASASVSSPRWAPDGGTIAVGLIEYTADGAISGGGLYLIPEGGGEPKLLQANSAMPLTATTDLNPDAVGYSPLAFSPDGTKILASRYSLQVDLCELAIIPLAGGSLVRMPSPDPALRPTCGPATWSADSSAVYTAFVPQDAVYSASAGLWRVDAATGAAKPLVPAAIDGKAVIVRDPAALPTGDIGALVGSAAKLPQLGEEVALPYQMVRIDAGSGTWKALRPETLTDAQQIAWAPDGSGAIVQSLGENGRSSLTWLPADGGPSRRVAEDLDLTSFAWGR